jgi:hypothetical protein
MRFFRKKRRGSGRTRAIVAEVVLGLFLIGANIDCKGCDEGSGGSGSGGGGSSNTTEPEPPPSRAWIVMNGQGDAVAAWYDQRDEIHRYRRFAPESGWAAEVLEIEHHWSIVDLSMAMHGDRCLVLRRSRQVPKYTDIDFVVGMVLDPSQAEPVMPVPQLTHGESDQAIHPVAAVWRFAAEPEFLAASVHESELTPVVETWFEGRTRVYDPLTGWESQDQTFNADHRESFPGASNVQDLSLAVAGTGVAFAAWCRLDEDVYLAARAFGSWFTPALIGENLEEAKSTRVVADQAGNAVVLWVDQRWLRCRMYAEATQAVGPLTTVSAEVGVYEPDLALNADGVGMAVWGSAVGHVHARPFSTSVGWTQERIIDRDASGELLENAGLPESIGVGVDADGNARAIWLVEDRIYTARYDAEADAWEPAEEIGTGTYPDLAMDESGWAIAVWWDEGFQSRVWPPGELPPASGEIAFASYRDGDFEIFTMKPDGSDLVKHTDNTFVDFDPVWVAGPKEDRLPRQPRRSDDRLLRPLRPRGGDREGHAAHRLRRRWPLHPGSGVVPPTASGSPTRSVSTATRAASTSSRRTVSSRGRSRARTPPCAGRPGRRAATRSPAPTRGRSTPWIRRRA